MHACVSMASVAMIVTSAGTHSQLLLASGTVLSLLAPADGKRMGLFSSQLGIAIRTRHPALQAAFEAAALEVL